MGINLLESITFKNNKFINQTNQYINKFITKLFKNNKMSINFSSNITYYLCYRIMLILAYIKFSFLS